MVVDQADVLELAKVAIARNPHLLNKKICLAVDDDCVRIQGNVSSYFEKQIAQETLRPIVAPLRIENELVVCWTWDAGPLQLASYAS